MRIRTRRFSWIVALGLCACARGTSSPVTPVAAPPAGQAPLPAPAPAVQPAATPVAPASPADRPLPRAIPAAPQEAIPDSVDDEFLDSLRTLTADSTAPVAMRVEPDVVRSEAASLFGRPAGSATAVSWDIDVQSYASHERVQYWMDYFSGRARWHFTRYLERLGRYDSMIRTRLAAGGLPQDMIYLAMIESGFNQNARSRAGAVGLWQFIPGTAKRYGLAVDAWVDDRRDPFASTDAAVRFLSELNNRFGSLYLAAAAYNSGPGKIQRGLRRYDMGALNGDDAFFLLAEGTFLRRETRDYVPKLIAAALLAKEHERYGFATIEHWTPLRYDSVQVDFAVGLDVVARLSGAPRDSIEMMNARFHRGVTPPDRRVWVRVPEGTADSVAARLAVLPARDRVTFVTHTVVRGETLSKIGRRYGVSIDDIKSANHLRSTRLRTGQRLTIPTSGSRSWSRAAVQGDARPSSASRASTRRPSTATASSRSTASRSAPPRASSGRVTTKRVHVVRSGETLSQIAEDFHVPLADLLRANNLSRRSTIRPGQAIRIPN